ncbi:MAG: M20/M25/M40 family metallo-hydrolase [Helicobacteraceae bacterium]|nr:M20/M25/M40 family metallo-hydrolase [Helicobacteraceae bacterium]
MNRFFEIFYELSSYPRSSGEAAAAREFICAFCERRGFPVASDSAGNLLVKVKTPKICLQAHYDMVVIGDHPPRVIRNGDYLRAQNGTLGADNGVGVALMLLLIERRIAGEYLFTNDEEIGLLGAKYLSVTPLSKTLINLDGEEEGAIIVGCAGGADYALSVPLEYSDAPSGYQPYAASAKNCAGGHSGVDIDKNIRSALVEVSRFCFNHGALVASIDGGEKKNAISRRACAVAFFTAAPQSGEFIDICPIEIERKVIKESPKLLKTLVSLPHGVLRRDENGVHASANFAMAETGADTLAISVSIRGHSFEALDEIDRQIRQNRWSSIEKSAEYPPWQNGGGKTAKKTFDIMKSMGLPARFTVMHAGLECAFLKDKLPDTELFSIGPEIDFPHSDKERVRISSIKRFSETLERIIDET